RHARRGEERSEGHRGLSRRRGRRGGRGAGGNHPFDRRSRMMSGPLLKVEGVETYYGNIRALSGVDVEVGKGEIVCLIGANGAGKSTLMMTVCGSPQARIGRVLFEGDDITRMPTHLIARRRIAQSPEGRRIFPRM